MIRKIIISGIIALLSVFILKAQEDVNQLLSKFISDDWNIVKNAKLLLESRQEKIVPQVLELFEKNTLVKLKNTATLIYPGADKFYGYGQIVDYDIDNLAIRAGWLLEDISFNNFGFTGIHLPDEDLPGYIKITFPEYYNNANNRKIIEGNSVAELRALILKLSIANAKKWWQNKGKGWTRLVGLEEALQSYDEKRQVKALFYMRNGDTKCSGLTKDYYLENLSKEIVKLSSSDTKRVSEHAKLILYDTKFVWLANKN